MATYVYRDLNDLEEGSKLNIMGVVVSFQYYNDTINARDAEGNSDPQLKLVVQMIDPTVCMHKGDFADAIRCSIFAENSQHLPIVRSIGDILRIHRIIGRKFDNDSITIEGKINVNGCHAVVWPEKVPDDPEHRYEIQSKSCEDYTMEDFTRHKLDELREWYVKMKLENVALRGKLGGILQGCYENVVVQVIAIIRTKRGSTVLKVWDGSIHRQFRLIGHIDENMEIDENNSDINYELMRGTSGMNYDIFVYDEKYKKFCTSVKKNDVLLIQNLHLWFNKKDLSFMFHDINANYKKYMQILSENDPRTVSLLSYGHKITFICNLRELVSIDGGNSDANNSANGVVQDERVVIIGETNDEMIDESNGKLPTPEPDAINDIVSQTLHDDLVALQSVGHCQWRQSFCLAFRTIITVVTNLPVRNWSFATSIWAFVVISLPKTICVRNCREK